MRDDFQSDAQKDPNDLEREIDRERNNIRETLEALEQRFSPGQIVDQVMSYTRHNGGDFSRNFVETVKNNPVPAILTATGLAWMMYGQNRSQSNGMNGSGGYPSNASYGVDPAYQSSGGDGKASKLKDKASHLRDGAGSSAGRAQEHMQHLSGSARERMHTMGSSAQHGAQNARQRLHDARDSLSQQAGRAGDGLGRMMREQPLALGAMGIALGALIGASIPRTQRENELMGEQRDRLAEEASRRAEEGYEKASEKANQVGERLAEDAKQEAQSLRKEASQQQSSSQHH